MAYKIILELFKSNDYIKQIKTHQTFFRRRRNDPTSPSIFLRQLFVDSEEIRKSSHHAELNLLERLHVRSGVDAVSEKTRSEKTMNQFKTGFGTPASCLAKY